MTIALLMQLFMLLLKAEADFETCFEKAAATAAPLAASTIT